MRLGVESPLNNTSSLYSFSSYDIYVNSTTIRLNPGATQDVVEGRSDIVINTRPFTPSYLIEYLYPHYFNPVSIFLPHATRISWSKRLLGAYEVDAMAIIFTTLVIALLVNTLLHRRQKTSLKDRAPLLEIICYFLQNSYLSTLRYGNTHRLFLVTWSFFALVIMSVVNATMYSYYVVPRYNKEIDTVDQLMETSYQIPITSQRYSLFTIYKQNSTASSAMLSDQYWRLMPKFVVAESLTDIFKLIEENREYAFMQTNGHCEYFVSQKRFAGRDGAPLYHLMAEIVGEVKM